MSISGFDRGEAKNEANFPEAPVRKTKKQKKLEQNLKKTEQEENLESNADKVDHLSQERISSQPTQPRVIAYNTKKPINYLEAAKGPQKNSSPNIASTASKVLLPNQSQSGPNPPIQTAQPVSDSPNPIPAAPEAPPPAAQSVPSSLSPAAIPGPTSSTSATATPGAPPPAAPSTSQVGPVTPNPTAAASVATSTSSAATSVIEIPECNNLPTDSTRAAATGFMQKDLEDAAANNKSSQAILSEYFKKGYQFTAELERDTDEKYKLKLFSTADESERMCHTIKSIYTLCDNKGAPVQHNGKPITFERFISTGAPDPYQAVLCAKQYMQHILDLADSKNPNIDAEFRTAALAQRVFYIDANSEARTIRFESDAGKPYTHKPDIKNRKTNSITRSTHKRNKAFERTIPEDIEDIHKRGVRITDCNLVDSSNSLNPLREDIVQKHSSSLKEKLAATRKKYSDKKSQLSEDQIRRIIATQKLDDKAIDATDCTQIGQQLFEAYKKRKDEQAKYDAIHTPQTPPDPARGLLDISIKKIDSEILKLKEASKKEFEQLSARIAFVHDLQYELKGIQEMREALENKNHLDTSKAKTILTEINDECKKLTEEINKSLTSWEQLLADFDLSQTTDASLTSPSSSTAPTTAQATAQGTTPPAQASAPASSTPATVQGTTPPTTP